MANLEYKELPELQKLVNVAREIVFVARRQGTLGSLTVKTIRRQVEKCFSLEGGVLEREDLKVALRDAIEKALEDSLSHEPLKGQQKIEELQPSSLRKAVKQTSSQSKKHNPKNKEENKSNIKSKVKSKEIIEVSTDDEGVRGKVVHTEKHLPIQTAKRTKKAKNDKEESTSDFSSAIDDEQPKKRRKLRAFVDDKKRKDKELNETPEETVKRLKSIVNACGWKPSWRKELANLAEPRQQIKHLKKMLAKLGMKNNYSIQAARAIKYQRDLEHELNDVIEFEKKAGLSRRRGRDGRGELDTETEDEESSSESETHAPASKKITEYLAKMKGETNDDE